MLKLKIYIHMSHVTSLLNVYKNRLHFCLNVTFATCSSIIAHWRSSHAPRQLSDCNKELEAVLRQQTKTAEDEAQADPEFGPKDPYEVSR